MSSSDEEKDRRKEDVLGEVLGDISSDSDEEKSEKSGKSGGEAAGSHHESVIRTTIINKNYLNQIIMGILKREKTKTTMLEEKFKKATTKTKRIMRRKRK